jgi:histidine triad (HIT) family protein
MPSDHATGMGNAAEAGIPADCPFCAIIAGRLPSSKVYADDVVLAFLDIRPANTGHLLVVPRAHSDALGDLPERTGSAMFATAQRLARALRASGLRCDGTDLFLADGAVAGQEVGHVHLHVLPRFAQDGFKISARWVSPDRAELDATAERIRIALNSTLERS